MVVRMVMSFVVAVVSMIVFMRVVVCMSFVGSMIMTLVFLVPSAASFVARFLRFKVIFVFVAAIV